MNSKESSLEERMQEEMDRFEDDPEYRAEGYYLEVTEKVLERMSQEGISKAELARRMDCSKSHITQLFQGVTNITLETLAKLAVTVNAEWEFSLSTESSASDVRDETQDVSTDSVFDPRDRFEALPEQPVVKMNTDTGTGSKENYPLHRPGAAPTAS